MEPVQKPAIDSAAIEVRHCTTLAEFEQCVRLEQITWGTGILVPSAIFLVAEETGGQILGAFDGKEMAGFTLALAGVHGDRKFIHSHMTAVLEPYRDRGVGRALKLFQRQDALARGFPLVEWTFDPLELRNAYFNFMRLGAIARRYLPNFYGVTDSPLHAGMPTDRFMAEWWLDSPRVKQLLGRGADARTPVPEGADVVKISVPSDILALRLRDRAAGERIQAEVRAQFQIWLGKDYAVTAIVKHGATAEYFLQPVAGIGGEIFPENYKRR
jgi:predicted GNAT superfamily acetyltransferase